MEDTVQSVECLVAPPGVFWLAGIALLALVGLAAVLRYRANRGGIVPFESEEGRIEISRGTVRSLIEKTVEQMDGIEEARCRLQQKAELAVHLSVTARAPVRLQELDAGIKRRVRSALKTQIGLEAIDSINIRVTDVLGEVDSGPDDAPDGDDAGPPRTGRPD
ncbi:MAG: hypothetical protein JJU00_04930 [Opitutales bacterium]|nr:hypothetical protein [Opitutales bacterium]